MKADEEMAKLMQDEEELLLRKLEYKKYMIENKLALEHDTSKETYDGSDKQEFESKVNEWLKVVGNPFICDYEKKALMKVIVF